jgi:hypothetical protein
MLLFFNIRSAMVSKHSELTKRQAQNRYRRFASPSSRTAPPTSCQEVGNSSRRRSAPPPSYLQQVGRFNHRRTTPPSSRQEEASSNDSVEIWVVAPPRPPPPTCLEDASSSDDSPSDTSSYNDECHYIKEVSLYELLLFQLFSTITKCAHIHFHIQKLEKKLVVAEKELQQTRNDNQALA